MTGRQVYAYSSQTRDPTYGVSRGRSFSQQSYCVLFGPTKLIAQWWRIQELQKGGGGPGEVEFLGLGFVLMPLHTYPICL